MTRSILVVLASLVLLTRADGGSPSSEPSLEPIDQCPPYTYVVYSDPCSGLECSVEWVEWPPIGSAGCEQGCARSCLLTITCAPFEPVTDFFPWSGPCVSSGRYTLSCPGYPNQIWATVVTQCLYCEG